METDRAADACEFTPLMLWVEETFQAPSESSGREQPPVDDVAVNEHVFVWLPFVAVTVTVDPETRPLTSI